VWANDLEGNVWPVERADDPNVIAYYRQIFRVNTDIGEARCLIEVNSNRQAVIAVLSNVVSTCPYHTIGVGFSDQPRQVAHHLDQHEQFEKIVISYRRYPPRRQQIHDCTPPTDDD